MYRADELFGVQLYTNDHLTIYGPVDPDDDTDDQWFILLQDSKVIIPFSNHIHLKDFIKSFREILLAH